MADASPRVRSAQLLTLREGSVDAGSRSATFVAATEGGVVAYGVREHLRMAGLDATRYRANPVVLDAHFSRRVNAVVGRSEIRVIGKELEAHVSFATTARAEEVWVLVRDGFVRALSVGFLPDEKSAVRLREGESDGDVKGPAVVFQRWELYEISVVPIPADIAALRRSKDMESQIDLKTSAAEGTKNPEEDALEGKEKRESDECPMDSCPMKKSEADVKEDALRVSRIRALAPRGLETLADLLVLEGVDENAARQRFLAEQRKRMAPVGSTEPPTSRQEQKPKVTDELLLRSLRGW